MRSMRLFLFLATSFFLISFGRTQENRLVVIGDSLTEGYGVSKDSAFPALLEKKIQADGKKNWVVVNSGITGATTASALGRVKWVFKSKPKLLLLILGGNDGLRGLKVEESEKNLSLAIELAQKENVPVILGGLYMPPNYGKDYTDKFKKMYVELAKKFKVPLIPFVLDKVAGDSKYNLADGIHPNEAGHKIIAETIYREIKDML